MVPVMKQWCTSAIYCLLQEGSHMKVLQGTHEDGVLVQTPKSDGKMGENDTKF
jgi:hypothetical protein